MRRQKRRLRSKLGLVLKGIMFWAGPEWTEQMVEREIEAIRAFRDNYFEAIGLPLGRHRQPRSN
jgi:hypothetical protein